MQIVAHAVVWLCTYGLTQAILDAWATWEPNRTQGES